MKSSTLALFATILVGGFVTTSTGCAKKKAPAAAEPGSAFTVDLNRVELVRRDTTTIVEHGQLRYILSLNNGLKGGSVAVDRIDYTFGVGANTMGSDTFKVGKSVAMDGKETITIVGKFEWRDDSKIPAENGWIKGTAYWTGPNAERTTTFELKGPWTEIN